MASAPANMLIAERVELANPSWVRSGAPSEPAIVFALLGALSFFAAFFLQLDSPLLKLFACPFRAATGLPCLGCGATHAFVHLAHGEFFAAIAANPLWACLAAILWAHAAITVARLLGFSWTLALPKLSPTFARRARLVAFALVAANWCFVALR